MAVVQAVKQFRFLASPDSVAKSIVGKMLNAELLPVDSLECECWLESTLM